jgi:hypothetical protein
MKSRNRLQKPASSQKSAALDKAVILAFPAFMIIWAVLSYQ